MESTPLESVIKDVYKYEPNNYLQYILDLSYRGHLFNLLLFIVSQFIFLSYSHYAGLILIIIAVLSSLFHIWMSILEYKTVRSNNKEQLDYLLDLHFIVNQIIMIPVSTITLCVIIYMIQNTTRGNRYCNY